MEPPLSLIGVQTQLLALWSPLKYQALVFSSPASVLMTHASKWGTEPLQVVSSLLIKRTELTI